MNCLPTVKIISGKSKNKYLPQATQKYEQRIKESKNKHDSQLLYQNIQEIGKQNQNNNIYIDEWIRKRKEIDKWRKNVLFALQTESLSNTCSSNLNDSLQQPDSSTLTTSSTLCTNILNFKKESITNNGITPTVESHCFKIQKSPSIPLFQSNSNTPMNGTNIINNSLYYNYYTKHCSDSKISLVDDDEVFAPSNSPFTSRHVENSTGTLSSSQFLCPKFSDSKYNNVPTGVSNNLQFTSVPNTKLIYFPTYYFNQTDEYKSNNNPETPSVYEQNELEDIISIKHRNSIYYNVPNHHVNHFGNIQQSQTFSSKKTLHKNETNAKIVLRPSNSSYNNGNQRSNSFFRTRSLNIKRSPEIIDDISKNPEVKSTFKKVFNRNPDNSFFSHDQKKPQFPRNNNYTKNVNNSQIDRSKYIVLKPTFSQENISSNVDHNYNRDSSLIKMNSYCNLQSKNSEIPKVTLFEPLTMRIVFKSEPILLSNL